MPHTLIGTDMNAAAQRPLTRWGAALRHLLISLAITGLCFGTLFWLWYSPGLWSLAGIPRALWLLLGAVTVAGPLMTLAAFRRDKREIRTDMMVIIVIHAVFFAYAVYAFGRIRPVFLVTAVDRLELVRVADLAPADIAAASKAEYKRLSWTGPTLVGIDMPEDSNAKYELIMSGMAGKDVQLMPKLYADYTTGAADLLRYATPLEPLAQRDERAKAGIERALSQAGRTLQDTRFVPIRGAGNAAVIMLLDATSGSAIRPVGVNPWIEADEATGNNQQAAATGAL